MGRRWGIVWLLLVGLVVPVGVVFGGAVGNAGAVAAPIPHPGYTAVAPQRLLDTRRSPAQTLGPGAEITVRVAGVANVPSAGVVAVALNVTGIAHAHSGYLTVFPASAPRPATSNLNLSPNVARANAVITEVGADGQVTIFNSSGSTDVLVDVNGWFAQTSSLTAQSPVRLLDTRLHGGAVPAGHVVPVQVTGRAGVPASGVSSVVVNLTGISTHASAYLTASAAGSTRPATSNLNLAARQTAAVLAVVAVDRAGQINVYNSGGPTHVVLDVVGWFTGTTGYAPVTPTRLMDTRTNLGASRNPGGDIALWVTSDVSIPPDTGAVVLSVTAVQPTASGYLTVHPFGQPLPRTSSVNAPRGATVANLVVAQLSADGTVDIHDAIGDGDVLVDVVGWLASNPTIFCVTGLPTYPAEVSQAFATQTLRIGDGTGAPYAISAVTGSLPPGLTTTSDGTVVGTPTTPGSYSAQLSVSDSTGESATCGFAVHVDAFASRALWAWGINDDDILGSAAAVPSRSTPVLVDKGSGFAQVTTAGAVAYAVKTDGTAWSWGTSAEGLLGTGQSTGIAETPAQIPGLSGVRQFAITLTAAYALQSDGTVWAWGTGPLGDGSTVSNQVHPTPIQIPGLSQVVAIASGTQDVFAVTADSSVWGWGDNHKSQLGTAASGPSFAPVQVPGITNAVSVAANDFSAFALTNDGRVIVWGDQTGGALGNHETTGTEITPTTTMLDIRQIAAHNGGAYALGINGVVWAWGVGGAGQLGNDQNSNSAVPVPVQGLPPITQISAVDTAGYALDENGGVWAWGERSGGYLGDGEPQVGANAWTPGRVLAPPIAELQTPQPFGDVMVAIGAP